MSMFFVGVMLLGGIAWQRLPVELFPALQGDRLYVQFSRPGSDPEVIEREILLPLQARVSALSDVSETFGEPISRFANSNCNASWWTCSAASHSGLG